MITSLEDKGYPDLVERAYALKAALQAARSDAELAQRSRTAERRLEAIRSLSAGESGPDPDPERDEATQRARLEEALRLIGELVEGYPDTEAAQQAQALRGPLVEAVGRFEQASREREAKVQAAKEALSELRQGIARLLREPLRGAYAQALKNCQAYNDAHGAVESKAGRALAREVELALGKATAAAIQRARSLVLREAWDEARLALEPLRPPLGIPEREAEIEEARTEIDEAQRASQAAAAQRERRAAEALVAAAWREGKSSLEGRSYGAAARPLRDMLPRLELADLKQLTELRASRLEAAQRVLERLFEHLQPAPAGGAREPKLWLELEVAGKTRRAYAAAGDPLGRMLTFAVTEQILRDVHLTALSADDLLTITRPLARSARHKLDLACLAYELGQGMRAEQLLQEARGESPGLEQEAQGLRILAGAGQ